MAERFNLLTTLARALDTHHSNHDGALPLRINGELMWLHAVSIDHILCWVKPKQAPPGKRNPRLIDRGAINTVEFI